MPQHVCSIHATNRVVYDEHSRIKTSGLLRILDIISGTQAFKRDNFMRMIRDANDGKIDLILTKSISRFARNTLDTLKYVRELKANGIAILFEEENINTLDMAGELLLTVLSSVAQQESETISSHIKLGIKMKRERGELAGFATCYGYSYNSKTQKMTIIEDEAKIVRFIYEKYINGYGSVTIANMINAMGILSPRGKSQWRPMAVIQILSNEKYVGDVLQGKTYTTDSITHKRVKNNGEEDKYYIKDHHEGIISREMFEEAREIRESRNSWVKTGRKYVKNTEFSGRIRCGFCGGSYFRRDKSKRTTWCCSVSVKGIKKYCPNSRPIPEDVIKSTFMECYYLLTANDSIAIDEFITKIKESLKSNTPDIMKAKFEEQKLKYKTKLNKLIDLYVDGGMDKELYAKKQKDLEDKISEITKKIEGLNGCIDKNNTIDKTLEKIKLDLRARESQNQVIDEFDFKLFDNMIDYVICGSVDESDNPNGYIIRFICKRSFNHKSRKDINELTIMENGLNKIEDNIYIPILDFLSTQKIGTYIIEDGIRKKIIVDKVRVRLEIEK